MRLSYVGGPAPRLPQEDLSRCVALFRTLPEVVDSLRLLIVSGQPAAAKCEPHCSQNPWGCRCGLGVTVCVRLVGNRSTLTPTQIRAVFQCGRAAGYSRDEIGRVRPDSGQPWLKSPQMCLTLGPKCSE